MKQKGQATVEFAFALIATLFIVAAMVDGAPLIFDWLAAKSLSAKGAMAASIYAPDNVRTCRGDVLNAIGEVDLVSATYTVEIPAICDWSTLTTIAPGTPLKVTVNVMYTPIFLGGFGWPPRETRSTWPFARQTTENAY